jgi:hypothetical protein
VGASTVWKNGKENVDYREISKESLVIKKSKKIIVVLII